MVLSERRNKYDVMLSKLNKKEVVTWFDMGLLLDQIKDGRKSSREENITFEDYNKDIAKGIGFISFDYGIDGVSIEVVKYAEALEQIFPGIEITLFGGKFYKESVKILKDDWHKVTLPEAQGFDDWDGYNQLFFTELQRGGADYNNLASKMWKQIVSLATDLGKEILDKDLQMLIPVNIMSNPGNVALSYAIVVVSEMLEIPVLASCHDFYWEFGKSKKDRSDEELPGLRDHFFCNDMIGEVFTLIETLYPWDSSLWHYACINKVQTKELVAKSGINPIRISNFPTSIDLDKFSRCDVDCKVDAQLLLHKLLSRDSKKLKTVSILDFDDDQFNEHGMNPICFGYEDDIEVNLKRANLLFIQPTRILKRKRIELNFKFIDSLVNERYFEKFFAEHPQLTITLVVTGPIAKGNRDYFMVLLGKFKSFLLGLPESFKSRIFLAFAFGIENSSCVSKSGAGFNISDVYSVADAIFLPSETEGRGLPIIESAAAGVPLMCSRYSPEHVYSEVIGESLGEDMRLKVFEFEGKTFTKEMVSKFARVLLNSDELDVIAEYNHNIVEKRFNSAVLEKALVDSVEKGWSVRQIHSEIMPNVKKAFRFHSDVTKYSDQFNELVLCKNRKYIPGFTDLEFMIYLKSLIDPSFFRKEEVDLKAYMYKHALFLVQSSGGYELDDAKFMMFLKHVEYIFELYEGVDPLAIDHSLSYRHRHRRHYLYRKMTEQELRGIIGIIFRSVMDVPILPKKRKSRVGYFSDLRSSIRSLVGGIEEEIIIDDSKRLVFAIGANVPVAVFIGRNYRAEIRALVVNALKRRLDLSIDADIEENIIKERKNHIQKITIFARRYSNSYVTYNDLLTWINDGEYRELKLLFESGLVEVVPTDMQAIGIHLGQLGKDATEKMLEIKKGNGIVVAFGESSFMADMIDMDSYRMGRIRNILPANFMGIPIGTSFIQWVPAGLKPSLAYPTPVQTPLQFHKVLRSDLFYDCVKKLGEEHVLAALRDDADKFGTRVKDVLEKLLEDSDSENELVKFNPITGLYSDGLPWSGALVTAKIGDGSFWKFITAFSGDKARPVVSLVEEYESSFKEKVKFAWNGGYILNSELVGKLGLPEDYVGTPLGLVCKGGHVLSLPLYNKAAFLISKNGNIEMRRVNLFNGLTIKFTNGKHLTFGKESRNNSSFLGGQFFDSLFEAKEISGVDRIIFRLAGNKVIEKITDGKESVPILPVGLTVSVPFDDEFNEIEEGEEVEFGIPGLEDIDSAIEAGPMLVESGNQAIDMDVEGFKTENSIATQAARLDYLDMRGPKMVAGITADGDLILVAINGRIRESVGATHIDVADILIKYGAVTGMGFDPGGSVTLLVDGKQLNISPYNKKYEQNIYSLPPTARFVGNAVLGVHK